MWEEGVCVCACVWCEPPYLCVGVIAVESGSYDRSQYLLFGSILIHIYMLLRPVVKCIQFCVGSRLCTHKGRNVDTHSIVHCLYLVCCWAAGQARQPRCTSAQLHLPGRSQSLNKWDGIYNCFSMFWVGSRVSLELDIPEKTLHSGGTLLRCLDHLKWLHSMWRNSKVDPSSSLMSELLNLPQRRCSNRQQCSEIMTRITALQLYSSVRQSSCCLHPCLSRSIYSM